MVSLMSRQNLLPRTAPFGDGERASLDAVLGAATPTQRAWLAGFLAGLDAAGGPARRGAGRPAQGRRAADGDLRQRIGELRGARRQRRQARAQAGLQAEGRGFLRSRRGDPAQGRQAHRDRGHLGRGRAAGARRAGLWRADGGGRPAPRRGRVRRAGAGRHVLRGVLRHREGARRAVRGAGRQARRGARRPRPRLREARRRLDQGDAEGAGAG